MSFFNFSIRSHSSLVLAFPLLLLGCGDNLFTVSEVSTAPQTALQPKSLSQTDPSFKPCIFQPQTRIGYFPMYHFPTTGQWDNEVLERVSKSQFQLLHTILNYSSAGGPGVAVFDEHITSNMFNRGTFRLLQKGRGRGFTYTRVDGRRFNLQERYQTARFLFGRSIPLYYNHLREDQKRFLFETGASKTLYYLNHILQIHKVIEPSEYRLVIDRMRRQAGGAAAFLYAASQTGAHSSDAQYFLYGYREEKLRFQVDGFFHRNPGFRGIVLIAYGAEHRFSDDFQGYLFERGPCLAWDKGGSLTTAFPNLLGYF